MSAIARPLASETCWRLKCKLGIGNFEMNYETVEVRFKTGVDYDGDELRPVYVRNAIVAAMDAVEAYADLLHEVMKGDKSAKEAANEAHARSEE